MTPTSYLYDSNESNCMTPTSLIANSISSSAKVDFKKSSYTLLSEPTNIHKVHLEIMTVT